MEFADGGYVKGEYKYRPIARDGCEYYVGPQFASERVRKILDELNKALDRPVEDGVE